MSGSVKIFGIGHSKTGTVSLTTALQYLGYSAIHNPPNLRQVELHDAATDMPVTIMFEQLDRMYPGGKFIYTIRDLDPWLESWRRHWLKRKDACSPSTMRIRKQILGTTDYDAAQYTRAYRGLDLRVRDYFAARAEDLLILNICDRPSWKPICDFLGKSIPNTDFPWSNRTSATDQLLARAITVIGDIDQTAHATGVSTEYLRTLPPERSADRCLDWDDGGFSDRVVASIASHLDDVDAVAAALTTAPERIAVVLARHRERQS